MEESIREGIRRCERVFGRPSRPGSWDALRIGSVRDQGKNRGPIALVYGLLSIFGNVGGLVRAMGRDPRFDLRARCGLDGSALEQFGPDDPGRPALLRSILGGYREDLASSGERLLDALRAIQRSRLLGRETAGKMAYVRDMGGAPLRSIAPSDVRRNLVRIRGRTLALLRLQERRLSRSGRPADEVRSMIDRIRHEVPAAVGRRGTGLGPFVDYPELSERIKEMVLLYPKAFDPGSATDPDGLGQFCSTYGDEVAQALGDHLPPPDPGRPPPGYRTGRGIEVGFSQRDDRFLTLGDVYGDCTARRVRSQVDADVANIHWTVYPWLLSPHYRVLEVTSDGDRAMKAHLLPLVIKGRAVLAVDALEVVPTLRDRAGGRENAHLSARLFGQRSEILGALFDAARRIGGRMGAGAILVDKFSNAEWVRTILEDMPTFSYHVRDVDAGFVVEPVRAMVREILGDSAGAEPVDFEIQAGNLGLMDQGLRPGYKEVGVLEGDIGGHDSRLRGP